MSRRGLAAIGALVCLALAAAGGMSTAVLIGRGWNPAALVKVVVASLFFAGLGVLCAVNAIRR